MSRGLISSLGERRQELRNGVKSARLFPIVLAIYFVYSLVLLSAIATTTLAWSDLWPALVAAAVVLLVFGIAESLGFGSRSKRNDWAVPREWLSGLGPGVTIALSFVAASLIMVSVTYYSGSSPAEVWSALTTGGSRYEEYQRHNELISSTTGLLGSAMVLARVVGQLFAYYVFIVVIVVDRDFRFDRVFALLLLGFASIYGSLARGTTFESFKLLLLILFLFYVRSSSMRARLATLAMALPLGVAVVSFFSFNVNARGTRASECLSLDVCPVYVNPAPPLFGAVSNIAQLLYGYFGHGFFYVSRFLGRAAVEDHGSVAGLILPPGMALSSGGDLLLRTEATIDMGPRWRPDLAIAINEFGIGLVVIGIAALGFLSIRLAADGTAVAHLGRFVIFVQMCSIPVGNFVSVAAEFTVAAVLVASWYLYGLVRSRNHGSQQNDL